MKFSDHPEDKKNDGQRVTPQSAMDDYFEDMFGASFEDPLKSLSQKQSRSVQEDNLSEPKTSLTTNTTPSKVSHQASLAPQTMAEQSRQVESAYSPLFDEPEVKTPGISPLIIPAAFPKMAPVKPSVKQQTSIAENIRTEQVTQQTVIAKESAPKSLEKTLPKSESVLNKPLKQVVKPKVNQNLDAKAALAILEKNRSKLSVEQIKRLEAKLAVSSQLKSLRKDISKPATKINSSASPIAVKQTQGAEVKPRVKEIHKSAPVQKAVEIVRQVNDEISVNATQPVIHKDQRPDWASRRFECLIFSVAGLKLAVPLISLGAIYKIEKEFIPLVGRASWFMGLYHHLDRNVRVIDTAQWVMPERCSPEVRSGYEFIIRLGGNDWGMACDAVHQSIQLYPEQVKWRTERTKRAWLFGTVIDHMCALIDADSLGNLLNEQATKNPRIFSQ